MRVFVILIFTLLVSSCTKDEMVLTGNLEVRFNNTSNPTLESIGPKIYSISNTSIAIYRDIVISKDGTLRVNNLLCGDYVLEYSVCIGGLSYVYRNIGFQITPNNTKHLSVDI